jgi:hypothetical protein
VQSCADLALADGVEEIGDCHQCQCGVEIMGDPATSSPARVGLPAPKYVLATLNLAPRATLAPGGPTVGVRGNYRILRTEEVDAKDTPLSPDQRSLVATTGAAAATRSSSDNFEGTARKAAKLSISEASIEAFDDIKAVIESLPSKSKMVHHNPHITTDANSDRVAEEERNVRVAAFLFAASRENDNDFHLIVGRDVAADPPMYMTMEISGLPPQDAPSFSRLKTARDAFSAFFGENLPGSSYDFYDPPIPIKVEGSLFFDMSHANGRSPGPPSLHDDMPVIWEIHPISDIVLEPQ